MPNDPDESNIIRHDAPQRDFEPAVPNESNMEAICDHFTRQYGEAPSVYHEIISDRVHIDIHMIPPVEGRNHWVCYTTGMSDRPMNAPKGAEGLEYAELFIKLPGDWPGLEVSDKPQPMPESCWPIFELQKLAHFPHLFDTWISEGHTIPNGDPPEPYAPDTELCCFLLHPPVSGGEEFATINLPDRTVYLYQIMPIHLKEMMCKVEFGTDRLVQILGMAGVTDVIDPARPDVVKLMIEAEMKNTKPKRKKRFGFF